MPNGVADPNDTPFFDRRQQAIRIVLRLTPPVPGRWGEADSVPGGIYAPAITSPPAINGYVNLVHDSFTNPVRAGYSYDVTDTC